MLLTFQLKDASVNIDNLTPGMAWGALKVFSVLRHRGIPFLITSGNDGTHKAHSARHPRSLHYEDRAIDFRLPSRYTGDVGTDRSVKNDITVALGGEYDVVLESDHFHVEHDPKLNVS